MSQQVDVALDDMVTLSSELAAEPGLTAIEDQSVLVVVGSLFDIFKVHRELSIDQIATSIVTNIADIEVHNLVGRAIGCAGRGTVTAAPNLVGPWPRRSKCVCWHSWYSSR